VPEGLHLECNSVQISQILMNLLGNAMDSVQSRPDSWVRLDAVADEEQVVIRVTDSGARLTPEVAERVMQPFFTTKPVGQGTGLGLPISLGIAEAHGGRLYLDPSSENVSFVLELPRRQKT
jgi:C4-dicarboxylate-specific signal transduction histidine kinase